jgi:glycine oxidase
MLAPVTEADFGEDDLLRLNLESAATWPAFAQELEELTGIDTGYLRSGALAVAADRDDAEELRRVNALQQSLGLDAEWLVASEARRREPGLAPRIAGAIDAPGDAQADPVALMAALERAFVDAGGELRICTVRALTLAGSRVVGVDTDAGRVDSGSVVLAAGSWSGHIEGLPPGAALRIRPVKGQLLHLHTRPGAAPVAARIVRSPRCYIVPRPDGRVIVGATSEERGFDTTVDAGAVHRLLEAARELLPDIGELEFEAARAGLRPGTPDNRPLIGPSEIDGLVLATGHYRNGILLAPVTAARVADALAGEKVAA